MKEVLINDFLLTVFKTSKGTYIFDDWGGAEDIVCGALNHTHLLQKSIVDIIITDYYVEGTISLITPKQFFDLPKDYRPFIFSHNLAPFPYIISGAPHSRYNLIKKIESLIKPDHEIYLYGNKNLLTFHDLKPYFDEYAVGFKDGFKDFIADQIEPYLLKLENDNRIEFANRVFKFITNDLSEKPRATSKTGFDFAPHNKGVEIGNIYQDGLLEGYLYRAWSIIFSENELFLPIFKKYRDGTEKLKVLEKDIILKKDNNLIPRLKIEYVYEFFSVLTKPNTNGDPYLSEQKLLTFIESTFVNDQPIQQSFDVSLTKEKKNIRTVFKKFQDNCYQYEKNQKHLKQKYFDIMFKGFKGFSKDQDYKKWCETSPKIKTIDKPRERL
ncbi:hypothetical protein [Cellulophaga baltica]|uniref:Uncharacterized protein n=1 Tax=Cellulophaga baltica TaxID=76594 RepID=A0A1G7JNE1_9FLAO|nr:hypothetical protein [Cellulophaga baltica]SDF26462.1 hypothetical protein SAMN04487992_11019 [Cellulophaga baltica]